MNNVFQPIYFIADTGAIDSGAALLRVGLVEETALNKLNLPTEITYECYTGYFISKNYNDADVSIDNPLFIIYPTPFTVEEISEEPRMPTVICKATLKKFYPGVIKYEWKYIVRKFYHRTGGLCMRISRSEFQGLSYSTSGGYTEWTVPFIKDSGYFYFKSLRHEKSPYARYNDGYGCSGEYDSLYDKDSDEIFTGGEVMITLTAKNQYGNVIARLDTIHLNKILGSNPDPVDIFNYTNDNVIKAILDFESYTLQFSTETLNSPYGEPGWPLYGYPNGYGLMQLDYPAATERQMWNWKENIDGGKEWFYTGIKQNNTDKFLNKHPATVTENMRLKCAYQKYNLYAYDKINNKEHYYYKWNGKKWIEDDYIGKKTKKVNGKNVSKKYGDWVYDIYSGYNK